MKKIEDYLHLYLGCEVVFNDKPAQNLNSWWLDHYHRHQIFDKVKLVLRPLDSMTDDELEQLAYTDDFYTFKNEGEAIYTARNILKGGEFRPYVFHYLLSKGFDLFNLIPEGLAIDLNKAKKVKVRGWQG